MVFLFCKGEQGAPGPNGINGAMVCSNGIGWIWK